MAERLFLQLVPAISRATKPALAFVLAAMLFSSCEKAILPKSAEPDPVTVFETLWKTLDRGYSFFDYKNVNWDSVYNVYRPRITNNMSNRELFAVSSQMLRVLRDNHVNLRSGFSVSYYDNYYLNFPPNFNKELIDRNYLRGFEVTGPIYHTVLNGNIGYLYYGTFTRPVSEAQLDTVLARFNAVPNLKGIIIDVRNNEGGNPVNGYRMLKRFATANTLILKTIYKDGPGRNDFSAEEESIIKPETDRVRYTGKVAVLTNRKCYSACNFFVAACKAFPQIRQVGDQTGGGGGQPTGYELPNGWAVNFSGSITTLPNGFNIEDGVPPDVPVQLSAADEAAGIDTIIERAKTLF